MAVQTPRGTLNVRLNLDELAERQAKRARALQSPKVEPDDSMTENKARSSPALARLSHEAFIYDSRQMAQELRHEMRGCRRVSRSKNTRGGMGPHGPYVRALHHHQSMCQIPRERYDFFTERDAGVVVHRPFAGLELRNIANGVHAVGPTYGAAQADAGD